MRTKTRRPDYSVHAAVVITVVVLVLATLSGCATKDLDLAQFGAEIEKCPEVKGRSACIDAAYRRAMK